jgi:hypothetical protein
MPVIGWDGTETHLHLVDVFAAVQILSPTATITTVWHRASGEAPFKTIQVPVLAQSFQAWINAIQVWYSASIITLSVSHTVTRGLRVSREQLFLRLLLTTCRASEYTLDLESCLGTLRQS